MFTTLDVDCKSWKCPRNRQQQSKPPNLDHTCTFAYFWLNYDNSQTWIKVYSFRALCLANHDLPFWIGQQRRYKSDPLALNPCMGFLQNRFHDNTLWSFNITMEPFWIGESKNHSTLSISNKLCGSQMVNHTLDGFYIIYTTYIYVEREYTNCKYSNCTYIYIVNFSDMLHLRSAFTYVYPRGCYGPKGPWCQYLA